MPFFTLKSVLVDILLLSAIVCLAQSQTILSGHIDRLDIGSTIFVSSTTSKGKVDSLTVTSDSFRFKLNVEKGDIYFLDYTINSQSIGEPVYLQKGADVHITRSKDFEKFSYTGSSLAEEQNNFLHGLAPFYNQESLLDKELLQTKDSALIKKLNLNKEAVNKNREDYYINWVKMHPNSPFSVTVIYLYMQQMRGDVTKALYDSLSSQAKDNNAVTALMPYYFAERNIDERFKVGRQIQDFTLPDTVGKTQSFSNLKGNNYVLLDIWASWCGPCRKSTPEIRNLLNEYQQQNFKVISISADTDSRLWKEAIIKDTMNWYHLSDLQGTDAGFMKDNYIFAYPTYILISPEGTIISKPYSIEGVKKQLAQFFKEK